MTPAELLAAMPPGIRREIDGYLTQLAYTNREDVGELDELHRRLGEWVDDLDGMEPE